MKPLDKIQKAIRIQGYLWISIGGAPMKARRITDVGGVWTTDIPTGDLCGYVCIRKTKSAVVAQAEGIIAREAEICAARESQARRASSMMMS